MGGTIGGIGGTGAGPGPGAGAPGNPPGRGAGARRGEVEPNLPLEPCERRLYRVGVAAAVVTKSCLYNSVWSGSGMTGVGSGRIGTEQERDGTTAGRG